MTPTTSALIAKAEMALATAEREMRVEDRPNFDAVCFHSERCAERYLKARLHEAGVPFPESTRHLVVLLQLCLDLDPGWEVFRPHLRKLTTHGFQADDLNVLTSREAARESLHLCTEFRFTARRGLGLPV
jgi:HEPN domain-containing protein